MASNENPTKDNDIILVNDRNADPRAETQPQQQKQKPVTAHVKLSYAELTYTVLFTTSTYKTNIKSTDIPIALLDTYYKQLDQLNAPQPTVRKRGRPEKIPALRNN